MRREVLGMGLRSLQLRIERPGSLPHLEESHQVAQGLDLAGDLDRGARQLLGRGGRALGDRSTWLIAFLLAVIAPSGSRAEKGPRAWAAWGGRRQVRRASGGHSCESSDTP